jgi:hypothetical protein
MDGGRKKSNNEESNKVSIVNKYTVHFYFHGLQVLTSSSDLKDFLLEVNILRKMRHP